MPTPTKGRRLGGSPAHERMMLANLASSLFEHGRIRTTEAKARRVRPLAEKLITKAKRGDLHNRRLIQRVIHDKDVVHKLMAEIGPFYEDRPGGYTRINKTTPRKGDNAPMAVIELVQEKTVTSEAEKARGTRFAKDEVQAPEGVPAGAAVAAAEAAEVEAQAEEAQAEEETSEEDSTAVSESADDEPAEDEPAEDESGEADEAEPEASESAESEENK